MFQIDDAKREAEIAACGASAEGHQLFQDKVGYRCWRCGSMLKPRDRAFDRAWYNYCHPEPRVDKK